VPDELYTMPKDSSRPSLPATSSDFALPSSMASTSQLTIEETNFVFQRFRRGSLLAPKAVLHSPLQASFTASPSPKRKVFSEDSIDDSDVYRERILSDSSPSGSSENPTPPLAPNNSEEDLGNRLSRGKSVSTPPRKFSSSDSESHIRHPKRRLSFPVSNDNVGRLLLLTTKSFSSSNLEYSTLYLQTLDPEMRK
jgi:hypothetical protein